MKRTLKLLLALLAVISLFAVGCGSDSSSDTASSSTTAESTSNSGDGASPAGLEGSITVSAAASLTEAYTRIGDDFTAANPDAEVTFNFDSSSTLSTQILEGAPGDVYASADEASMAKLTDENLVAGEPEVFARNELVIVSKPGNPEGITGLADLVDAGVLSLCGEEVPCGMFTKQVLDGAGIEVPESNVTRGQNVKATLTSVTEGDAVAGIVYVTDARAAGDTVDTVAIPADQNAIATYPIGVLAASGNAEVAAAFMVYVLSGDGQAVLEEFGFLPPA